MLTQAGVVSHFPDDQEDARIRSGITPPTAAILGAPWNAPSTKRNPLDRASEAEQSPPEEECLPASNMKRLVKSALFFVLYYSGIEWVLARLINAHVLSQF